VDKPADNDSDSGKYQPVNYDTQKAVWISYLDMSELLADSESEFEENVANAFSNVASVGCNTVYVHVRAFGDAYYDSRLFPAVSAISDGNGGVIYDPLEIMTVQAHRLGLSLHAWINPFRCGKAEDMVEGTKICEWFSDTEKYPEFISQPNDDEHFWLNPACAEVRELIADGAAEIAENYDVDGIHIDDYFYPTTDESFDSKTFAESDFDGDLSDWRLENCSETVREIYSAVKSVDSEILFGVSPQGNIDNNYTAMYADVRRWCAEDGYLDYIVPQIYFGYENSACPFAETLAEWVEIAAEGNADIVCGIGFYKLESDSEFADDTGIIARQISDAFSSGCGVAFYNYGTLFSADSDRLSEEREKLSDELST
jgi:uncharacterized lipoprotein YddW (UPF0748 family)